MIKAQTDNEGFTEAYAQSIQQDKEREADKRLVISFRRNPVLDEEATAKAGRPIHVEKDYITIVAPGDKCTAIDRAWGWPNDERRFGHLYKAWLEKNREGDGRIGTPLAAWPLIGKAMIADLAYFNVRTVEDLANLSDVNAQSVGPIMEWRQKARDFMAAAEKGAVSSQLRKEVEDQKARNATLEESLKKMQEQIDALTAPPKAAQPPRR